MPLVTDDAVVLQAFAYGETSKVLRLLTRTHGVRSAIAKGARRPKSRFAALLEPFAEGTVTLHLKEGRDLQTLGSFELTRSRQGLGGDLFRFGGASLLTELVLRTASEASEPALFEQFRRALDRIERAAAAEVESVVLAESWALIGTLGFAPAVGACIVCGRKFEADEESIFDYAAGGMRCPACEAGSPGRPVPAHARAALERLCRGEAVPLERTGAHWQLLGRFLAHHVGEGGALRSLAFLASALEPSAPRA